MSQQRPDRIKQMLHYLWQHRHLSTQQAIELFGYAEATVRRDFHYIASRYPGMVRGHGCIDFDDSTEDKEYVFDVKRTLQSEAKREIAALARTFIKDGDCFFLDSGSTCLELAKCLVDAKVKVICNDIKIANELGGFPHVESYIIGGLIRPGYFSVGESLALEMINAFAVERAFISCDALSIETGITNATMFEVGVKTRIIQRSREVILMADHSKFDTVEPHAVATLSCITTILSDSALPSAIARRYQQAGCRLIMSDPSSDIRHMNKTHLEHWRGLRKQLWPGHPDDAHLADGEEILQTDHLASFIAMADGVAIGFADASIRHDYVNGCDSSPVVFLEGIFVLPSFRQRGVAKQLIAAVQRWGKNKGCREMASDTSPENTISRKFTRR